MAGEHKQIAVKVIDDRGNELLVVRKLSERMNTLALELDKEAIARFCRERGIRKLSIFGSALRDDFAPERSDLDVLVEFLPGRTPGLQFFGYERELSDLIGQRVDLNTPGFLSKYFRDEVVTEAVPIYEQA